MLKKLAILVAFATALVGTAVPSPASAQVARPDFANTACPEVTDSIVRLYSAYFLRAPDQAGFDFWVSNSMSGAHNLDSMSDFFSISDEFNLTYGSLTNTEFVDLIYQNILGRPGEPEGRAFWISELDSGNRTRGNVMINFSEGPEYVVRSQTFTPLAGYFNWYPAGTTYECGFGPGQVTIDPSRFYDIALSNYSNTPQVYDIDSIISGAIQNEIDATVAPLSTDAYFNNDPFSNFGSFPMQITVDASVAWIVVSSPSPLPTDRSGWDPFGSNPMN